MNIIGIFHINLNCRSLEVSLPFYQALGFEIEMDFPVAGHPMVGKGLGVGDHQVKGALLKISGDRHATRLDLLEWIDPKNDMPSPLKLTDPGFVRVALASEDWEADVAKLREIGVKFISEPIYRPNPDGTESPFFVCFYDPDGNVLELVNSPRPAAA